MISSKCVYSMLRDEEFNFWTGVPCSYLTPLINSAICDAHSEYVAATSEGEAVAIASGAQMAGAQCVVLAQNSGLGNMVNPLTSLAAVFRIPMLLIVTHRGEPDTKDEPQHELMGRITVELLKLMEIPTRVLGKSEEQILADIQWARRTMKAESKPVALVVPGGLLEGCDAKFTYFDQKKRSGTAFNHLKYTEKPTRYEVLREIDSFFNASVLVATTGKTGRELFTIRHSENHFYMVGSMGCAAGIGLGIALSKRGGKKTVVIDGDGAILMKMGTLATIGTYQPREFIHFILDNESYDSTGMQPTTSPSVDFSGVALACGYSSVFTIDAIDSLREFLPKISQAESPTLVHIKIKRGSLSKLGRPTLTPFQVKEKFIRFLEKT